MNKPLQYFLNVICTLLLIFCLLGTAALGLVTRKAVSAEYCKSLVVSEDLADKVQAQLLVTFREQENTSGIPASVYENALKKENLTNLILGQIESGMSRIQGGKAGFSPDCSVLEADLHSFFVNYAMQEGIPTDDVFEAAAKKSIDAAKAEILTACDVFCFARLDDAGVLTKAAKVVPHCPELLGLALLADVVLVVLLYLINRRERRYLLYWCASAGLIASLLMLVPAAWLQHTRWFDRFAIKSDQIFAAVCGYLYGLTGAVIGLAAIGIIAAALLYVVFALLQRRASKAEPV